MATWAIGDVQGCFETLRRLLARIGGPPPGDRVVLVGDLVNRGPRSLEVLRWAADAGDRVEAVLGNHDVHLLARAVGVVGAAPRDTLDEVLEAPDRDALLGWLRARPLLLRAEGAVVVHAGLLPSWTVAAGGAPRAGGGRRAPEPFGAPGPRDDPRALRRPGAPPRRARADPDPVLRRSGAARVERQPAPRTRRRPASSPGSTSRGAERGERRSSSGTGPRSASSSERTRSVSTRAVSGAAPWRPCASRTAGSCWSRRPRRPCRGAPAP